MKLRDDVNLGIRSILDGDVQRRLICPLDRRRHAALQHTVPIEDVHDIVDDIRDIYPPVASHIDAPRLVHRAGDGVP